MENLHIQCISYGLILSILNFAYDLVSNILNLKGLILLARKFESIPEKIVRLYKSGYSIERIASEMGMPKDNVPKILERHMPDYQDFVQPDAPAQEEPSAPAAKKSIFNTSVSDLFKKKSKPAKVVDEVKEPEPKPVKTSINLTMSENGFVDGTVRGIASMLQNGKDVSTIADFFSRDEDDIIAVRERMDEHFKRVNSSQSMAQDSIDMAEPSEDKNSGIYASRGNMMYASGLEDMGSISASAVNDFSMQSYDAPHKTAMVSNEPEVMDEMPSIDPESLDKLEQKLEEFDKQTENKPVQSDEIPEVETADAYAQENSDDTDSSEDENNELEVLDEAETQSDSNENDDNMSENLDESDNIDINAEKEDDSMTPMEKMKKFAEEQIAINNKKIDELKERRAKAEENTANADSKLDELLNEIEELQKKVTDLKNQSESLAEEKSQAKSVIEEIDAQIAEIEKENEEFKSYFK